MAARTLPNLGLKAFFAFGEDGWNDELDTNFLRLSVLTQGGIISIIDTKPGSPAEGSVYLMSHTASSNPDTVAVFDNGAWVHLVPSNGWTLYNRADDSFLTWVGTAWQPSSQANLRALAALSSTLGVVEQTGANTFTKRAIGIASSTDLLTRADGDTRFAAVGHTHPVTGVTAFNTRAGAVTLSSGDVTTALGFTPATSTAVLTSLGSLNTTVGLIEQTGANAFTKRNVGISGPTDIPTLAQADARYQGINANLTSVSGLATTSGLVEQYAPNSFRVRLIGGSNSTDILTRANADSIYVAASSFLFTELNDVPASYTGKGHYALTVKSTEDAVEFTAPGQVVVRTITTDTTLALSDAGSHIRGTTSSGLTITVPNNSSVAFPIGTTLVVCQSGSAVVTVAGASGVTVDIPSGTFARTSGQHTVIRLIKYDTNSWTLFGSLAVV